MSKFGEVLKTRLLGLGFLLLLAILVTLSILQFQHVFTPVVMVTLQTDQAGNQLNTGADVKLRGVIVGDVRTISTNGTGAKIALALQPDSVGLIPANVIAQLLPKTLFGEKYVSLVTQGSSLPATVFALVRPSSRTARPTPPSCSRCSTSCCRCCTRCSRRSCRSPSTRWPPR
ncbi:MCE family protein [Fodinicola feengrottensis]|uniref:MCE family protein n=1 Tax=Fodinicola feengrottensis TaxID=435914 RepID=UPI0013D22B4F|nr:MCE family protein [Fodinicola feengrottensis]